MEKTRRLVINLIIDNGLYGTLKPCPFCGGEAVINYKQALNTWIVECSNLSCPASYMIGMDYDTEAEAIEAWNRRAYE